MQISYELEIIPGVRVGKFQLGWDLETLKEHIDFEYTCENVQDEHTYIQSNDFWFHLNRKHGLYSIYTMNGYKGSFRGLIGIGTVLSELKGNIDYEIDKDFLEETMWWRYHIPGHEGMHLVPQKILYQFFSLM